MEFRETLLAAQKNQQQKSSESTYYKARFDPPKKEQRQKDRLSANIQKFLAKKDEEEKQKKLETQRKRDELLAMRDPKALRKIQKTLKVIKSANKSVLADAVDHDNTAVTLAGSEQPDQDDYGYESQEAAALYEKMMQKYSKIPDEPKFPIQNRTVKKDLNGTIERVKHALQHEDDLVPHKRKRRTAGGEDREVSPPTKYEPEKKKDEKPEKPRFRKPAPPPLDFNQLLKLAEQKKCEPLDIGAALKKSKPETSSEPERLMTKKQKREYEEEMLRRQRRQERIDAEKGGKKIAKDNRGDRERPSDRPADRVRKPEPMGFGRIPKIGEKANGSRHESPKSLDKDRDKHERDRNDRDRYERDRNERDRHEKDRHERDGHDRDRNEKVRLDKPSDRERPREREVHEKDKVDREKERLDKERLEKLKAERDRIEREMERLNKDRDKLDKTRLKLESKSVDRSKLPVDRKPMSKDPVRQDMKKSIDLKTQNTYRIDKNSNERKIPVPNRSDGKLANGHSSQGKPMPKQIPQKDRVLLAKKPDGSPKLNGHARPDNDKRLPDKSVVGKRPDDRRPGAQSAGPSKPKISNSNSFDFDKHVSSLRVPRFPPGDVKRKPHPDSKGKPKRRLDSESEYDSEMDDFIDDGDEEMDYSRHIKEIFGYDKSKYRYIDDDDDPNMESNFVQQQREEYISKKHGIMEDLEDMRLEAMMKAKSKGKKKRRISDD